MAKSTNTDEMTPVQTDLPVPVVSLDRVWQEADVQKDNILQYKDKCKIADNNVPFFITECVLHEEGKFRKEETNPTGAFWELTVDLKGQPKKIFFPFHPESDKEFTAYHDITVSSGQAIGPATLRRIKSDFDNDWFVIDRYNAIPNQQDLMPF